MARHPKIRSVADSIHTFLGLYGRSGIGKTRLLSTYKPKESGKTNLFIAPPTEHRDSIREATYNEEWIVKGHTDMGEVLEYLRHEGGKNHELVVFDSASLFQDTGLDEIWEDLIAEKPHREKYGLDKPEYGKNMDRLARWVRHVVGLDEFHFAFTAHPFRYTIPATGEELLFPFIQGKNMPEKFCGYMNIVAYYDLSMIGKGDNKKPTRVLRFDATPDYYAKDQYDAFQNGRLLNPTMPKIFDAIAAAKATRAPVRKSGVKRRVKKTSTTRRRTA